MQNILHISPYAGALAARPLHPSGTMNPRSPNGISPGPGKSLGARDPGDHGRPTSFLHIPPLIDMCLPETGVYIPKNIPKLFFYAI